MNKDIKWVVSSDLKNGLYLTADNLLVKLQDGEIISVSPNPYPNKSLPFVFIEKQMVRKQDETK